MSFEMALFAALLTVIGIPAVIYGLGELLTSLPRARSAGRFALQWCSGSRPSPPA